MLIYLKRIFYWVVFGLLWIAFLLNISATAITFIKQKKHKVELQKKDVIIKALLVSCEIDKFLFTTNPKYQDLKIQKIQKAEAN